MDSLYPPMSADPSYAVNQANATADPEPALDVPEALDPNAECPFHTVMRQLAGTAVRQHILHIEGEVLPRADLVAALDKWQELYHLLRNRVCPATRIAPLVSTDIEARVGAILPSCLTPGQASVRTSLCRQIAQCAGCQSSQDCPLHLVP